MRARNQSEPDRELRLALVLNGGVSLAVWMSGVTHEIDNCRRAASLNDQPSREVWRRILKLARTSVTVDVVAGTSAGGLNGTVLARAISQDENVPDMKRLWLRDAALAPGRLLFPEPNPSASLLNGTHFLDSARNLLNQIPGRSQPTEAARPTVTLLVTATALPIRDGVVGSDAGEGDSRRVYRFRSRPGVSSGEIGILGLPVVPELNELDDVETLALATRASASFPAAFQPVWERDELRRYQVPRSRAGSRWLMDGGVLDNAPFEPTLDELRRRSVSEVFDRDIVYINPATANPVKPHQVIKPGGPGIVTTLAAFASASREPDRRLDRERLHQAVDAIGYTATDPDRVLATVFRTPDDGRTQTDALHEAAAALMPNYRSSRAQVLYLSASLPASATSGSSDATASDYPGPPAVLIPTACDPAENQSWKWGLTAADRMLRWWGRALSLQEPSDERRDGLAALSRAQLVVQQWSDDFEVKLNPYRGQVVEWYIRAQQVLTQQNIAPLLNQLMGETAGRVAPGLGTKSGPRLLHTTLDLEVVSRALAWRADSSTDVPDFTQWEITPDAPHPCDLGAAGGDPRWPARKLYGEQWGHFGAFASERGRRWDWLWGRLDAAMIVSDRVLRRSGRSDEEIAQHQNDLIDAILREELRPASADGPDHRRWLEKEAAAMLERNGRSLWLDFVAPKTPDADDLLLDEKPSPPPSPADTAALRKNLLDLASVIPGAAIPRRWPYRVHALFDNKKTWQQHRPPDLTIVPVLPYWAIGRVARVAAGGWLRKVLKGKVGTQK